MLDHMGVSQAQVRTLTDVSRAAPRPVMKHAVDIYNSDSGPLDHWVGLDLGLHPC